MDPHPSLPEEFGQWYGHRRLWRKVTTQEISLRVNHRRRKVTVRAGVLASFAFAMVIYPIFGTLSPSASAVALVPGVNVGDAPATVAVVLGEAPGLGTAAASARRRSTRPRTSSRRRPPSRRAPISRTATASAATSGRTGTSTPRRCAPCGTVSTRSARTRRLRWRSSITASTFASGATCVSQATTAPWATRSRLR